MKNSRRMDRAARRRALDPQPKGMPKFHKPSRILLVTFVIALLVGLALAVSGVMNQLDSVIVATVAWLLGFMFMLAAPALSMEDGINASNGGGYDWT